MNWPERALEQFRTLRSWTRNPTVTESKGGIMYERNVARLLRRLLPTGGETWSPVTKASLAACIAILLALAITAPAYADCYDPNNSNVQWCGDYTGCGSQAFDDTYYAEVATQSGQCYWYINGQHVTPACPFVYNKTQGAKGNISTGGNPYVFDANAGQHVLQWITARENTADCTSEPRTGANGCWVQVGWEVGLSKTPSPGCTPTQTIEPSSPTVEVELYDDSSAPCLLTTFGAAPSNASYDGRYYAYSGGYYQYNVYFEVPGSNNIQWLAYADFNTEDTAEIASAEAHEDNYSSSGYCPVVGQTPSGYWNQIGQQASQQTFASHMQLYQNGSWVDWTTAVAPTYGYIWPPNGHDYMGRGASTNPYQIQAVSNWGAGNFTQWETGGPQ